MAENRKGEGHATIAIGVCGSTSQGVKPTKSYAGDETASVGVGVTPEIKKPVGYVSFLEAWQTEGRI